MAAASFETVKFISEIKKHPTIHDVNCLQYIDRTAKINAWKSVCKAMVEDWNNMSDEDKAIEEKNLRNKWRNIRDYFMKEVKMQRKGKSGGGRGRKRKKYSYYNHLLFLIPSVKKRGRPKNSSAQQLKDEIVITDDIEIVTTPGVDGYTLTGVSLETQDTPEQEYQHQTAICEASLASFDNEIPVDVLANNQGNQRAYSGDDDYDKMFLLSLLPSLRVIPEHMKLHVRIQMQQILASAFHPNNHHAG